MSWKYAVKEMNYCYCIKCTIHQPKNTSFKKNECLVFCKLFTGQKDTKEPKFIIQQWVNAADLQYDLDLEAL